MKILILTDRYPPYYEGGYELMCQRVVEGLRSRNHDLLVLTTTWGFKGNLDEGFIHRKLSARPVQLERKWIRRFHDFQQMLVGWHDYRITHQYASQFKPDLVFVWHMSGTSWMPLFAIRDLALPAVFMIGSTWLISARKQFENPHGLVKHVCRSILTGFRRVEAFDFRKMIMVSESIRDKYASAGFNIRETVVIPNGIPESWIHPSDQSVRIPIFDSKVSTDHPYLRMLYAGRLEMDKGIRVALDAMKVLVQERKYSKIQLDLVGKGESSFINSLKKNLKESGLEDLIHWNGFWSQADLQSKYNDYDLFLFPSIAWEGFGMTIIEAMSQGLPVIASDVGGPGDIIQDGENGILVSPGSAVALANGIERLIRSPELRQQIAEKAIRTVKKSYVFEKNLERYEEYLAGCLRKG